MEDMSTMAEILHDLVLINRRRKRCFGAAMRSLKPTDIDLRTMFTNMANHSEEFTTELKSEMKRFDARSDDESRREGKLFRNWSEARVTIEGQDRRSLIATCEHEEAASVKAYDAAVAAAAGAPSELRTVLENQRAAVRASHAVIKRYLDMHEATAG